MCIIAAIRSGGSLPSTDTLATMWASNPDGAGVMWADGGRVYGVKGLMSLQALQATLERVPAGAATVIHCRIATSGGIRPEMCHPWPVTRDPSRLLATTWDGHWGIAHNGILPGLGSRGLSDTGEYIRDVAAPLLELSGDLMADRALSILRATSAGSRLAIMDRSGRLELTGDGWETGPDGVMYSNGTYKATRWTTWDWGDAWDKKTDTWTTWDDWSDLVPLWDMGAYIIDEAGELDDGDDYAIAPGDVLHVLDYDDDGRECWTACPGCRAFTAAGVPLTYDRALAWEEVTA